MDNISYVAITRLKGLRAELQSVANNIANVSTTGYQRQGVIFSEHIERLEGDRRSISMARAQVHHTDTKQGALDQTNGSFDFAIEGPGYFLLETPAGERLTRAGAFTPTPAGDLVAPDGARLLDAGGAPIFVPPDAREITLSGDGTLSADGQPIAQLGLWQPGDPVTLRREEGVRFSVDGPVEPQPEGRILQGFVENSNVNAISEITRMIEVQRAYESAKSLSDGEDERIRSVLRTLGS